MSSLESYSKGKADEAWNSIPFHVFMDRGFIQHQNNFAFNSTAKSQAGERLPFKSKHKAGSGSKDGTVNLISQNICRDKDCGQTLKPCRPTSKQICYQKCVSTQSLFLKLYHERETSHPAQPILPQQYQNPLIRQSYKISFIFNTNLVTPPSKTTLQVNFLDRSSHPPVAVSAFHTLIPVNPPPPLFIVQGANLLFEY